MSGINKLVIWGASGHAKVVADIVRLSETYEVAAFFDDSTPTPQETEFLGIPLLKNIEQLREIRRRGVTNILLAFGHCSARLRLSEMARNEGFALALAVHPQAVVAIDMSIGAGSVIAGGAVINPGCVIGENVIVNTSASIDHECIIEDGAHIGPGARLGGIVRVGRASWVGIGATVRDRVSIGANSIIGAGSVVLRNIPENVVAYGVPARIIRSIKPNEN